MYGVAMLCFLTLQKWPSVGDVLCVPEVYSLIVTQEPGTSCPRVGSNLCLWTQFCRLQVIGPLLLVSAPGGSG